jgi:hypothetical protein
MSRKYILRTKIFRPLVNREVYTLQTTEQVFPGGEWVEEAPRETAPAPIAPVEEGVAPPSSNLTIIGDTKKHLEDVLEYVYHHTPDRVIVGRLPSGRGAESTVAAYLLAHEVEVVYVDHDPDLYGKSDVNVEQVMSYDLTSPVLLVGNGTRVKTAKSWLARAEWDREVITL